MGIVHRVAKVGCGLMASFPFHAEGNSSHSSVAEIQGWGSLVGCLPLEVYLGVGCRLATQQQQQQQDLFHELSI